MDWLSIVVTGALLGQNVDSDRDGLLDSWEISGFGPIDPKVHGCDPKRADVYLVFIPRRGVKKEDLDATITRIVKFYGDLDYTNPDGSKGLHAIPIVLDALSEENDGKDYKELYDIAMPKEWRGIGHGVVVDVSQGGGGQTNRSDWCGSSNRWETIVHELGHQFGLDHGPKGGQTGSPYHTSLMNYDYSYSFNGSREKVHYSTGKFKDLRMKETDLSERLPYPASDFEFLTQRPYFFKVQPDGENSCFVDWNRNGVFGEEHVRADVNDGYSLELRDAMTLGLAAGAPALVDAGDYLGIVTPVLADEAAYKDVIWKLSAERPGTVRVAFYNKRLKVSDLTVPAESISPVTGDATAALWDGKLCVATPITDGFQLLEFKVKDGQAELADVRAVKADAGDVTVVKTGQGVRILRWNSATGTVSISDWGRTWEKQIPGLVSLLPVGGTWNDKRGCLAVAVCIDQDKKKKNRVQIAHVFGDQKEGFAVTDTVWVEGASGGFSTNERPVLLFDSSRDRGPNGGYLVCVKGFGNFDERKVGYVGRQIEDPSLNEGWRTKMASNEWAIGMNMPGAAFYRGDVVYAYRLGFGEGNQKIFLSLSASGIEDRWLSDFDEVGFIFETGLTDSLRGIQRENGLIK